MHRPDGGDRVRPPQRSRTRIMVSRAGGSCLLLLTAGFIACNGSRPPARIALTIALPGTAQAPAPLVARQDGVEIHDLSAGGMVGRIRVEGSDMETVEQIFPSSQETGTDDDVIVISDLEVPAGEGREVSGVFYWNEAGGVTVFESLHPTEIALEPGEVVEMTLPLHETDTATLTVTLDDAFGEIVQVFPVDGELNVMFPPVSLEPGASVFSCADLPVGHLFWFRLEDPEGAILDTTDLPWCEPGGEICRLEQGA